jgi:hypothetical protein
MVTTNSGSVSTVDYWRPLRKLDLRVLPATLMEKIPWVGLVPLFSGIGLVAISAAMLTGPLREVGGLIRRLLALFELLCLAAGAVMIPYGLKRISERRVITIGQKVVQFTQTSLFGTARWSEPLANYKGILLRHEIRPRERGHIKAHLLELHHDDPEKSIPVYESHEPEEPLRYWEAFRHSLELPALEMDGDSVVRRELGELAKPAPASDSWD